MSGRSTRWARQCDGWWWHLEGAARGGVHKVNQWCWVQDGDSWGRWFWGDAGGWGVGWYWMSGNEVWMVAERSWLREHGRGGRHGGGGSDADIGGGVLSWWQVQHGDKGSDFLVRRGPAHGWEWAAGRIFNFS